ncbi:MAG: polymerase sigma factor [Geminicoccaceae bacterium]|jgi:RNA polymerase sigma factor (TIGR02999 family)|nr:polymerase sigma factor [Geminicoccaceae bacterium]
MTNAAEMQGGTRDNRPVDGLFEDVYASLKALAHTVRHGRAGDTLSTTALVHEAFLKLTSTRSVSWSDEAHFFAVAARAMRQIVIDAARRQVALKRGGAAIQLVSYDDVGHAAAIRPEELIALDAALERLAVVDPRRARVVEHRMFAGLSTGETARLLDVSTGTVERDWRAARAWLFSEIAAAGDETRVVGNTPGK